MFLKQYNQVKERRNQGQRHHTRDGTRNTGNTNLNSQESYEGIDPRYYQHNIHNHGNHA